MVDSEIKNRLVYFVVFSVVLGGELLIFALEYLVPKGSKDYYALMQADDEDDGAEICPVDYADIFSRFN